MNERLECSPSLKHKLKHTICGCFRHHSVDYDHLPNESLQRDNNASLTRTSSVGGSMSGMRSSRSEEFLNLKHKCRSLMSRMGTTTPRANHHRKSQSTDFRYDPLSYALNFDEDDSLVDDYPYRNFSARLPPSPPLSVVPPSRSISDTALDKADSSHNDTSTPPLSDPPPRVITAYS